MKPVSPFLQNPNRHNNPATQRTNTIRNSDPSLRPDRIGKKPQSQINQKKPQGR